MNIIVYKKQQKIKVSSITNGASNTIKHGEYAIKAFDSGVLTAKQVEAVRRAISRETKRIGRVFIRVFFYLAKTKKPLLSRMGKGCGPIKTLIAIVQKGTIILELSEVSKRVAVAALQIASKGLPLRVILIQRPFFINHWDTPNPKNLV